MFDSRIDIPTLLALALAALGLVLSLAWQRELPPVDPVPAFGRSAEEVEAGPRVEHADLDVHARDFVPAIALRRSWSAVDLVDPDSELPGVHFVVRENGRYDWSIDWMKQRRIPGFGDRIVVTYRDGEEPRRGLADIRAALEEAGLLSGIAPVRGERR